jgi:hypothetical protein
VNGAEVDDGGNGSVCESVVNQEGWQTSREWNGEGPLDGESRENVKRCESGEGTPNELTFPAINCMCLG